MKTHNGIKAGLNQPKPTTGEWTAESVRKLMGHPDYDKAWAVADAHNASLSADRESRDGFIRALEQRIAEVDQLRQQFSADREKRYKDNERCRNKLAKAQEWEEQLRQQLASAVEALKNIGGVFNYAEAQAVARAALEKIGEKP